jgi:PhnB protein
MGRTSTYLNYFRNTEETFNFYKSIFGGEFFRRRDNQIQRYATQEGVSPISEGDKNLVMHIELPFLGRHILMGTDAPESMGFHVNKGNNIHIRLEPDTREETESYSMHYLPEE